jgi:hypothetical protein
VNPGPLALAEAQRRNGRPGRPPGKASLAEQAATAVSTGNRRLLDVRGVAAYLSVSVRIVHELRAAGHLRPVTLPLSGGRELVKLLFDVVDVDTFINASK